MSKEITPPEENIITGDVSRVRTMPGINFSAEVVNKEEDKDKISVPTGRVVTEDELK